MKPPIANPQFQLGVDISKADFHVALICADDPAKFTQATFDNSPAGFKKLHAWLVKHTGKNLDVHLCMEATGSYGDGLAFHLTDKITKLSIVNPRAIKAHASSQLRRSKSDSADARLIADYCLRYKPSAWIPPTPAQQKNKAISRRLSNLKKSLRQESNRLETTRDRDTRIDIKAHIRFLENHISKLEKLLLEAIESDHLNAQHFQLLTSISGIGKQTAAYFLAEVPDISLYQNARQLAAHAGVTPRIFETGTSGKTRTPMSKAGNSHLRGMLFLPAMSALRFNPICIALAERLKAKGKPQIVILGAIMHKLLHVSVVPSASILSLQRQLHSRHK